MKRLTISVDELASIRYLRNDSDYDPVHFAIMCESAGAHGITATLTDSDYGIQTRDAQLIKRIQKTDLNLHLQPSSHIVKQALSVNPNMITFAEISGGESNLITPLSDSQISELLPELVPDFHASNISVAVYCLPEITTLKHLSRMDIDYVEFDCSEITRASDSNEELLAHDTLRTATMAATKLGIGVNCYGSIDYIHLPSIAAISGIEDICMGPSILKRALAVGIDRAIREAYELILHHQV